LPTRLQNKPITFKECTVYYATSSPTQAQFSRMFLYEYVRGVGDVIKGSRNNVGSNESGHGIVQLIDSPFAINEEGLYYLEVDAGASSASSTLHMIRVKLSY